LQSATAKGVELGQGRLDLAQTKTKSNQIRNGENHLLSLIGLNCVSQKMPTLNNAKRSKKLEGEAKISADFELAFADAAKRIAMQRPLA
jgi:hypothetical protein